MRLAPDDPEVIEVPGNVGAKPALYLPRRFRSEYVPVYLCNPLSMPMLDVVITSFGTDFELMASTSHQERRFARVEPGICMKVDALDPYYDAEMCVCFTVTWQIGDETFDGRTEILKWSSKLGVHFRLQSPSKDS